MYFRRKTSAGRAYLQIVESRREGDQVRQQVIATPGAIRGTAGERPAGAAAAVGRAAVHRQGDGAHCGRR
jgi:hypothetical protein